MRASYTSILDQLTNTTLARLKLGGSSSSDNHKTTRTPHTRCPALAIVPDVPEDEEQASSRLTNDDEIDMHDDEGTMIGKGIKHPNIASAGSSSSGLSSAGLAGVSPTSLSSSSCYSQQTNSPTGSSDQPRGKPTAGDSKYSSMNEDDSANISNEDDDDDDDDGPESDLDEQNTLVSLSARQQAEMIHSSPVVAMLSEDNLIKTKAILAELETFDDESTSKLSYSIETSSTDDDDDDDDVDDDAGSESLSSRASPLGHSIIQSRLINESELILKPCGPAATAPMPNGTGVGCDAPEKKLCQVADQNNPPGETTDASSSTSKVGSPVLVVI